MTVPAAPGGAVRCGRVTEDASTMVRWRRRALTLPSYALACWIAWSIAPIALPISALFDLARGARWSLCRASIAALVYLAAEIGGVIASLGLFVALRPGAEGSVRRARWHRAHYALQKRWATLLWRAIVRLYALDVRIEGDEAPGPSVCITRHASLIDTLLPVVLLDAHPRYVLKRELLADPCLDIVGQRIPNAFITRRAERADEDVAAVHELAQGLADDEVLVIYPEGTFFTPEKLARRLGQLGPEREARLRTLRHVLPPRSRGALAALRACDGAHVSILACAGLEGLRSLRHLTDGSLVGARVTVSIRKFDGKSVPREPADFGAWLDERWQELDAWIEARTP